MEPIIKMKVEDKVNTSVVVTQDRLLFNFLPIGYTVYATVWSRTEFEPFVQRKKWVATKAKAVKVAGAMFNTLETMVAIKEALIESEQLRKIP